MAPVREAVERITQSPVFVDESGQRRRWVMWALGVAAVVCMGYVLLLGFSFAGGPIKPGDLLPVPGLSHSRPDPTPSGPASPSEGDSRVTTPAKGRGGIPIGPSGATPGGGAASGPPRPTGSVAGSAPGGPTSRSVQPSTSPSSSSTRTTGGPQPSRTSPTPQRSPSPTSRTSSPTPSVGTKATPTPSPSPASLGAPGSSPGVQTPAGSLPPAISPSEGPVWRRDQGRPLRER